MHRRPDLPLGVKFDPTNGQLISGYLGPRVRGERLAWNAIEFSDLVYKKPPGDFCTALTAFPGDEKHYFFTELKKNKNRVVRTVGSYGTWHESSSKKIFGGNNYIINNNNGIIGFNKLLNFKVKGEGKEMKSTDWLMHEFSLPEKETNVVLCVIQKKNKKKEEMCSAYDTYHEFDPNSFLEHESTASAGRDPSTAPAPALDTEEEESRPSKKMRSDPTFDDDPFSGGDPCPGPAPVPALDLLEEKEESRPSKKMRSDPTFDDDPFSGGDPCPAPALDSEEEEETRPSKEMWPDPKLDHDPFSGGDPCPAPALDSEEEETRPSKKMQSDPKSDDDPFSGGDPCPAHDDVFEPQAFAACLSVGLRDISHEEPDLLYLSGWLMHEFSPPEKETNVVLCVIQKKNKKEEMCSAYDTYHEFDPNSFLEHESTASAGGAPSTAPAPAPALGTEEEETRPSKKMRSYPTSDDDPFSGGNPCPAPALDSEEQETRPSKEMQPDPNSNDHPFSVPNSSADHKPDFWTDLATGFPYDEFGLPDDVYYFQTPSVEGDS